MTDWGEALLRAAGRERRDERGTDGALLRTADAAITGSKQYRGPARAELCVRTAQISACARIRKQDERG